MKTYSSFFVILFFSLSCQPSALAQLESEKIDDLQQRITQLEEIVQSLSQEIQDLKKERSGEIQPTAIVSEPFDQIQPLKQYICSKGHIQEVYPAGGRCPICQGPVRERITFQKVKLSRREAISEKIAAAMQEEFAKRVVVGASTTGSLQQTIASDARHDSNFAVGSMDVVLSATPASQATLFLDLEGIGGNGPDQAVGSRSGLNADAGSIQDSDGTDRVQVRETWLKKVLFEDHLTLAAGKIDLTNYFDQNAIANDETTQFLSKPLVNNTALGQPPNAPGLVGIWDTLGEWRLGSGIQSLDDSGARIFDHVYYVGELGYLGKGLWGLSSNYRLWARVKGENDEDRLAVGTSLDQKISERVGIFARYGIAEPQESSVQWNWSLGVEEQAPFSNRLLDRWALGFSQQKQIKDGHEELLEFYYSYFISHQWRLSPHLAYLFKTAGTSSSPAQEDVVVVGVRSQLDF